MGRRQGGPSRTGSRGSIPHHFTLRYGFSPAGTKMVRDVTDEQRGRRPIFIATLRAGASWLFFRVARSTRMTQIWVLRSRLEKQPTDLRQYTCYFGDRALGLRALAQSQTWESERASSNDFSILSRDTLPCQSNSCSRIHISRSCETRHSIV